MITEPTSPPSGLASPSCYASSCGRVTLYLGDCMDIMPTLTGVNAVITDPPYPDYHAELYGYRAEDLATLKDIECLQLIFWTAKADFPLDSTAVHIWHKVCGAACASHYEKIFERNGGKTFRVYPYGSISSPIAAQIVRDVFANHPSQKPIQLMKRLVCDYTKPGAIVLDPWMGSGSTGVACVGSDRRFIGIERDPTHYATALERIKRELSQGDLFHSQHNAEMSHSAGSGATETPKGN